MREIKFRAQRADTKMWIYSTGYYHDKINYWFVLPNEENSAIHFSNKRIININTLGQFTGLKDKNGKDIYEGDVIEIDNKKGHVGFRDGSFISLYDWSILEGTTVSFDMWEGKELITTFRNSRKIIGNIYDNPELTKNEQN